MAQTPHQPSCQLTPYDVSYTLDLADNAESLNLVNGDGTMTQNLREQPNGWTFRQEAKLNVSFASPQLNGLSPEPSEPTQELESLEEDGAKSDLETQEIHWVYTIWEAKNGRLLRFIWQRWVDGLMDENIQGEVHYDPQLASATVTYSTPQIPPQVFHGDILFPIAYTQKIVCAMGTQAPSVVSAVVFSGNSMLGAQRLNTFVSSPTDIPASLSPEVSSSQKHLRVSRTFTAAFDPLSRGNEGSVSPEEVYAAYTATGLPLAMVFSVNGFKTKATLNTLDTASGPTDTAKAGPKNLNTPNVTGHTFGQRGDTPRTVRPKTPAQ